MGAVAAVANETSTQLDLRNEIFLFDSCDFFVAILYHVVRENLEHKRSDRSHAEAVW